MKEQLDFGKHRGKGIDQVDERYLQWVVESFPVSSRWHKAASNALAVQRAADWTRIHAETDAVAAIKMHARRGSMADARRVFDSIQKPSVQSWNSLLLGYADNGEGDTSVELFSKMKADGCEPDSVSYVAVLKACTSLAVNGDKERCLQTGSRIHSEITGGWDHYVLSALINMYAKCGSLPKAHQVFSTLQKPNAVSWTILLTGYADNGQGHAALALFHKMKASECMPNSMTYVAALKACTSLAVNGDKAGGLKAGSSIHLEVGSPHLNLYVQNTLIDMYAKCSSMSDAQRVFDSIPEPSVVSWTALLSGYADNGQGNVSLELFTRMKTGGCEPNPVTYIAAFKACTSLAANGQGSHRACGLGRGREIHLEARNHLTLHMQNTLIDMYAKFGSMVEARRVFESIRKPDVASWTALLLGYADNGEGRVSLDMFSRMKADRCTPNSVTYVATLKACTSLAVDIAGASEGLKYGRGIHSAVGDHMTRYVKCALIDMYCKCGSIAEARLVFDGLEEPDVVAWTALLMGYAADGQGKVALELFSKMKAQPCEPDSLTYVAVLKACVSLATDGDGAQGLKLGRKIHSEIGGHLDRYLQSTLIDMYCKCGSMESARHVFSSIRKPAVASWNALIFGYAETGEGNVALDLFVNMKAAECAPDSVTYIAALRACMTLSLEHGLERGKAIHAEMGSRLTPHLHSMLIDMYFKFGSVGDARNVFYSIRTPDVVSWTAMLLGYAETRQGLAALDLFSKMKAAECVPDSVTYIAVLKACTSLAVTASGVERLQALEIGRQVHLEAGEHADDASVQSSLIDMYAKCGSMPEARQVFEGIQKPSLVSWTALLSGYAENGEGHVALELLSKMEADGLAPNSVTYIALLKACGSVGALDIGRKLHSDIGELTSVELVTCLVDLYAKCGSMAEARAVFDVHPEARDLATWNALLTGYSSCGDSASVFRVFGMMRELGFRPDNVTFLTILSCCNHSGLVHKARRYLEAMPVHYRVTPDVFHYNSVLDLLGRANLLSEAVSVLRGMPCQPNEATWNALLSACREWKNAQLGRMAFDSLVELSKDASPYLLMAGLYVRTLEE